MTLNLCAVCIRGVRDGWRTGGYGLRIVDKDGKLRNYVHCKPLIIDINDKCLRMETAHFQPNGDSVGVLAIATVSGEGRCWAHV